LEFYGAQKGSFLQAFMGQHIGPIFNGHNCLTLEDGTDVVPKRRWETTILCCVKFQQGSDHEWLLACKGLSFVDLTDAKFRYENSKITFGGRGGLSQCAPWLSILSFNTLQYCIKNI